jgi:anti-sigma B factor antagonist
VVRLHRPVAPADLSIDALELADGACRLVLHGEVDLASATYARDLFLESCSRARRVEIDLADVQFLDSSGLQALVAARRQADRDGCDCVVVAVSEPVRRVLELTQTLHWLRSSSAS